MPSTVTPVTKLMTWVSGSPTASSSSCVRTAGRSSRRTSWRPTFFGVTAQDQFTTPDGVKLRSAQPSLSTSTVSPEVTSRAATAHCTNTGSDAGSWPWIRRPAVCPATPRMSRVAM